MVFAKVNGVECILFYDERIPVEKALLDYKYMYHLRHDEDNWNRPISIERFVVVNFFGTIFTKEPIEFDEEDYVEVEQFETKHNYVEFRIDESILKKIFSLQEPDSNQQVSS